MREILVAVDGSKRSDKVVSYASELARAMEAKVILVYVLPEPVVPEEYKELKSDERRSEETSENQAIAEHIISDMGEILKKKGVKYDGLYLRGRPAAKILEIAKSRNVALIVIGMVGLHGIGRIRALGSVSRRILDGSTIPVTVVP